MSAPPAASVPFALALDYAFAGGTGTAPAPVAGTAELDAERLVLLPSSGSPLPVPLLEILSITGESHALRLTLASGGTLALSRLGARFEDFLQMLTRARNEALLDAFWMREEPAAPPVGAELATRPAGRPCELRLLETALVVLFPDADPVRLPYALTDSIRTENYRVVLEVRWKGVWHFARLGRGFDPFVDALARATNSLHASHLDLIRKTLPGLDAAVLRNAGALLRDGVAVPVAALDAAGLWGPLEQAAAAAGASEELAVLKGMADPLSWRAGIKRGLAAPLSGDYLFFLVPLGEGGRAAALETVRMGDGAEEADGRATYLFRLDGMHDLDALNRDLLELNFRREPLLVPQEKLPRRRPAALETLRGRLLGRAVHRSPEGWKAGILALTQTREKGTH